MKVFAKNAIIKKILILLITIIMTSNFIMPNYVQASEKQNKKLVNGFFYLIAKLGDIAIGTMQNIMVGTNEIQNGENFEIKYGPGLIFGNEVVALDVNFINPNDTVLTRNEKTETTTGEFSKIDSRKYPSTSDEPEVYGYTGALSDNKVKIVIDDWLNDNSYNGAEKSDIEWKLKPTGSNQELDIKSDWITQEGGNSNAGSLAGGAVQLVDYTPYMLYKWDANGYRYIIYGYAQKTDSSETLGDFYTYTVEFYKAQVHIETTNGGTITSPAAQLQTNISNWYNGLRTIALVGLLSVLLYIGIRIILSSSSANDKAKYKNMLKDWLVAVCILFMLHYLMAFMLEVTNSLNGILKNTATPASSTANLKKDELMSKIRQDIGTNINDAADNHDVAGNTIMYLALVILTGTFTVQYLKRVINMAFLTMIAPMIALTYPLDKIKDGKAQAFSHWLREYIFNCLIQPVHFLLYTVLISSAITFAKENMLYAIVALAFLVPAEKFIKEMFGMKSQSPVGMFGAAASGAMVMSMLQKAKPKPPKDGAAGGGSGSSKGVRTATKNNPSESSASGGDASGALGGAGAKGGAAGGTGGGSGGSGSSSTPGFSIGAGLNALGKKHIYGADALKAHGKRFGRATGGAALGAAAGTVAFAAQIADGDLLNNPGKALGQVGATAGIGYQIGNNLTGHTINGAISGYETFREGAYGTEGYSRLMANKEFRSSQEYQNLAAKYAGREEELEAFLNGDIRSASIIEEAMENGIGAAEVQELTKAGLSEKDIKKYSKIKSSRQLSASEIAARMSIAKNLPPELTSNEKGFILFAKRQGMDDNQAKELFRDINDFA